MDEADAVIDRGKREGWYDDDRKIAPNNDHELAIPVVDPPPDLSVRPDDDPDVRTRGLADVLRKRGYCEAVIAAAPQSWAVLGTIVLARFDDTEHEQAIGEALLDLHGNADTVLATTGVTGAHRKPSVRVVAGAGDTETIHSEHGTVYAMDLATVMFSPGNVAERRHMGDVVTTGERIYDMFAGIGYFTLPMARAGAMVTAAERHPPAFRQLLENVMLNDVADRVDAYLTDCRELTPSVDRIVMGHFDARTYLDTAVAAISPGGMIHCHGVAPTDEPWSELEGAIAGAAARMTVTGRRIVKSHSPGLEHVVVDAVVD